MGSDETQLRAARCLIIPATRKQVAFLETPSRRQPMKNFALTTAAVALALGMFGTAYAADDKGSNVEPGGSIENKGALTAPEKDTMGNKPTGTGGMSDDSATNVPGADADQDPSTENQGSLSAPEKDKKM
jgi:hypothetical protein